jgi:hypothetical protein
MRSISPRKVGYLLSIVVLLSVVIVISQRIEASAERNRLAQKSLGNVNPVSGTAQLVLSGFRGVAVTFLWHEANELKKKERWFEIRPVIESISLLQPNFVKPWTFQAWNMSYNISAEWEAVEDKYYWIRQGIDFMKEGCRVNRDKPDLEWYVGYIYFNKFGMSDEKAFLRKMFREETDPSFAMASSGIQDNFEVAYDWHDKANEIIRRTRRRPLGMSITPFMYKTGYSKLYYADALADEGTFDEKTKDAWRRAYEEWLKLGREGGPNRDDLIRRMEFTPEEFAKLDGDQQDNVKRYQDVIKYEFWKRRARTEATDEMQAAREARYLADKARVSGDYSTALALYEKSFPLWRKVLEGDEMLRNDDEMREDTLESEARYLRLLSRLDMEVPEKRPFEDMYEPLGPLPPATGRDLERLNVPATPATDDAALKTE